MFPSVPCFVMKLLNVFLFLFSSFATEEERSGCYSQLVLILLCGFLCSVSLLRGAVG